MTHEVLHPKSWKATPGYSNGIAATGRMVFTGGLIGWNDQQEFETDDFVGQVETALKSIVAVLADEFVGMFIQPAWESFVQAAALSGVVPIPRDVVPTTEDDALFIGQSMPWIDPVKEAVAWEKLTRAGFASEPEVIRRRGANPRDVLEQTAEWRRQTAERGLVFSSDAAIDNPAPPAPAPAPDGDDPEANEPPQK